MELEELKQIWQQAGGSMETSSRSESLESILGKASRGPIARIRRNLLYELVLVLGAYSGMGLYYFWKYEFRVWEIPAFLGLLMALFTWYYVRKNSLLRDMACTSCRVTSNFRRQVRVLKQYVKLYLWSGTLIFPVVAFFFIWIYGSRIPRSNSSRLMAAAHDNAWLYWGGAIVLVSLLTVCIYYINLAYIQRLYGQHIEHLEELVQDMEETEQEVK